MKKINSLIAITILLSMSMVNVSCERKEKPVNDTGNTVVETKQDIEDNEKSKEELQVKKEISSKVEEKETKNPKEVNGFVLLKDMDEDFIIDLRYATENNFTKKKVYPSDVCVLRKETALKLVKANEEFKKLGYRIKIWDAYRPIYVQRIFWDIVKDSRFVANPDKGGSIHNKGCAVDITLVDSNGNELEMPSGFDDFSEKAYRTNNTSKNAKENMNLLTNIMVESGFRTIQTEWWHFDDINSDSYKIEDIDLNLFLN